MEFTEEPKQNRPMPEIKEIKFCEQERNLSDKNSQNYKYVGIKTFQNGISNQRSCAGNTRMHFCFDCQDAYYSCSVFPPHTKYLRFIFENQLHKFTALPNGLSSAPRFFTKIMKIALVHLRKAGKVTISGYLDDNIIVNFGDNVLAIKKGVFTADILQDFGFTINVPKSVFKVVSIIEHLGFAINSVDMLVTMTVDKTGTMTLVDKPLAKPRKRQRQSTAGKDAFIDLADDELLDILPYINKRARPSLGELGRSVYFATQHDNKVRALGIYSLIPKEISGTECFTGLHEVKSIVPVRTGQHPAPESLERNYHWSPAEPSIPVNFRSRSTKGNPEGWNRQFTWKLTYHVRLHQRVGRGKCSFTSRNWTDP